TLTFVGKGAASTTVGSGFNWHNRIFEITASNPDSLKVVFQDMTIEGGDARDSGGLGVNRALGGGLLLENGAVVFTNGDVRDNDAQGNAGSIGAAGQTGALGGPGGAGEGAAGGGIYMAGGTLSLFGDRFEENFARGGKGGQGGKGGGQGPKGAPSVTGGQGGT